MNPKIKSSIFLCAFVLSALLYYQFDQVDETLTESATVADIELEDTPEEEEDLTAKDNK